MADSSDLESDEIPFEAYSFTNGRGESDLSEPESPYTSPGAQTKRSMVPSSDGHGNISKQPRLSPSSTPKTKSWSRSVDRDSRSSASKTPSRILKPINETDLIAALGEVTNTLSEVVDRLDKQESQLKFLERKMSSTPSLSSFSDNKETLKVSSIVRSETPRMYQTLLDESDDFLGFVIENGATFKDKNNKSVVDRLIKEVQVGNPTFQAAHIRAAAYTYYRTLNQENSLKKRGMLEERNKVRCRRERTLRKLQDRNSFLDKSSLSEHDKLKWKVLMCPEFMSSEESDPKDSGKSPKAFHSLAI